MRAESAAMKFGDDWSGVFIRGDVAFGYRQSLLTIVEVIKKLPDNMLNTDVICAVITMRNLIAELDQSDERNPGLPRQIMKSYQDCLIRIDGLDYDGTEEVQPPPKAG